MANFRNTSDILDGVLRRCGEITSSQGTSPWQTAALLYLNQIHNTIISGGNEFNVDVDEAWTWAKSKNPIIIQLNPSITAGTASVTQGSVNVTLTSVPSVNGSSASVAGWHFRPKGNSSGEIYRIIKHQAGDPNFTLDAPYPQSTASGLSYELFQLDYDLVSTNIIIDAYNQNLDISEDGSTNPEPQINTGSYTPAALATAVQSALNSTPGLSTTYSVSYDSLQRLFTVTNNATPFQMWGAGSGSYASCWATMGFDYVNTTLGNSYTSAYPLDAITRLTQPARCYAGLGYGWSTLGSNGSGQIGMLDANAFDKMYPLMNVKIGTPDAYTVIHEKKTGAYKVRFNKYLGTTQNMRVEFDYIGWPKDLYNNTASIPLIPRKFVRLLEYGAAYYLCLDKEDTRAETYRAIAAQTLQAMMKENRRELEKTGKYFGEVLARRDEMPDMRRAGRLNAGYGYDSGY